MFQHEMCWVEMDRWELFLQEIVWVGIFRWEM